MDDNTPRPRAEFPVGADGRTIVVAQPTQDQYFMLSLTRIRPGAPAAESADAVRRVMTVLRACADPEAMKELEYEVLEGTVRANVLMELAQSMVTFDWPETESTPAAPTPDTFKPGPRLVSGG